MNETSSSALSAEGQARRDLMIEEVVEMAHRRYRRRRMLRIVSATACVVGAVAVLALVWPVARPETEPQLVHRIQTDPSVMNRYSHDSVDHIMRMDDRMLVAILDSINRPAQLIDTPSGVSLSTPVTDAELGL